MVTVYSGRTGAVLRTHVGTTVEYNLGFPIRRLGDMDGDGVPEYAASASRGHRTHIYSGADGKELFVHLADSVTIRDLGDLDGDGYDEAGLALFSWGVNSVWVIRGGTFEVMFAPARPPSWPPIISYFGTDISSIGDVNGDGRPDLAIGEHWVDSHNSWPSFLHVYAGGTWQLLYTFERFHRGCYSIVGLGDINGNKTGDFVVATGRSGLEFFEGSDGSSLGVVQGENNSRDFGRLLHVVEDINGNGCRDLVANITTVIAGGYDYRLRAIDGGTREILRDHPVYSAASTDAGPDWNGDGTSDYLHPNWPEGEVEIVSLANPWSDPFGAPCERLTGRFPKIRAEGDPRPGQSVSIRLADVGPDQAAYLALKPAGRGASGLWPPTSWRCNFLFTPARVLPVRTGPIGCSGSGAMLDLAIPPNPYLSGSSFLVQWLIAPAPGNWATTSALRIRIQ